MLFKLLTNQKIFFKLGEHFWLLNLESYSRILERR